MSKVKGLIVILAIAAIVWAAERSAFDLMLQGHYGEAKAIINNSNLSPRYELLYYALTESNAARACSLFQVIAIRYPNTECDSVARNRLDQARDIGFVVIPIAEWAQAPANVRSLYATKPPAAVAVTAPVEPAAPMQAMDTVSAPPSNATVNDVPKTTENISTESGDTGLPIVKDEVSSVPVEARPSTAPVETPPSVAIPVPSLPSVSAESSPPAENKPEAEKPAEPVVTEATKAEPAEPEKPAVVESQTEAPKAEPTPAETPKVEAATPAPEPVVEHTPETAAHAVAPVEEPKVEAVKPVEPEPVVKATPPSQVAAPSEKAAARGGHWFVQVGAFGNPDNAHRLEKKLQQAGYSTKIVPRETSKGTLLQVRVGGYTTRAELNEVMPKLKSDFSVPTVVVSE